METIVKQNEDGSTTHSVPLSSLSLNQLVQLSQGLGRKRDEIDAQMRYLRGKINERLAAGERDGDRERAAEAEAQAKAQAAADGGGDAVAPGAMIEASASS